MWVGSSPIEVLGRGTAMNWMGGREGNTTHFGESRRRAKGKWSRAGFFDNAMVARNLQVA